MTTAILTGVLVGVLVSVVLACVAYLIVTDSGDASEPPELPRWTR